jgi:hypothetical protein
MGSREGAVKGESCSAKVLNARDAAYFNDQVFPRGI